MPHSYYLCGFFCFMEKLQNNSIQNQEKYPEIFGITEEEIITIHEQLLKYQNDGQSYNDWCKMYNGIHREGTFEQNFRNWLACYRWIKQREKV